MDACIQPRQRGLVGNVASGRVHLDAGLLQCADCGFRFGRDIAAAAEQYQVAPRTVVSWVQKARRRGLLTPARPGVAGGEVRPS